METQTDSGSVLRWLPVLAALALLGQVSWLGLRPALAERDRLRAAAPEVEARYRQLLNENLRSEREAKAFEDPIFRERLLRLKAERLRRQR